ncbi:uncharacterized protein LOC116114713 [Pistacia vera]|uniref:uncharacterized protein LOC116114713 n=1 Tax=Pistacia vera TaxID=55513 RepID=UPI00126314C4|nr:uncharacterized protein LOC116114713 [Pistacia vera]
MHEEEALKAPRALSHIHSAVTDLVFTRIMACKTAKESWDKFKEFMGSDTTRNMQVLNLRREFETLRMQEAEKVKEYVDKLMNIVNKIRLLGVEMLDNRIVEKVVAQEKRTLLRLEDVNEGAMLATYKGKTVQGNCRKKGHAEHKYWFKPGIQCRACKQFGHVERVCKKKGEQSQQQAQTADEQQPVQETKQLFVVQTCDDTSLIDSGCTHHMTPDLSCFVNIDHSHRSKIKVGNGEWKQEAREMLQFKPKEVQN